MKRLEYQEETVERFTSYLETLVSERDKAEKFAQLARDNGMEPPNVDWCGKTWDALKASGVLPKAKDASGALFVPPWLHRADGIGRPVPNVCLKLPTGAGGVPVGELTLDDQPGPMRFRLVLEGDWKSQVDAALLAEEA